MTPEASLPQPGDVLVGRYLLHRLIGRGGVGAVYEAEHLRLKQRVAIKVLLPSLRDRHGLVARLEREARALTKLQSPHAARVTDVDTLRDGTPFLVMELLEGHDLAVELAHRGPLPVAEAVDYVLQACDAIADAHALGIVHRDLKPANLFLAQSAGKRRIKLLDFGISKIDPEGDERDLTATTMTLGTPRYMSPEQVRSARAVDARTDIWSLGVILYELVVGRTPFDGESATAVSAAIVADPVVSPRSLRPDLPVEVDAVILRALAKNREQRFADVRAFAAALASFSGAPADLQPAASSDSQKRARTRRKLLVLLAAVSFAALAVGLGLRLRTPSDAEAPLLASASAAGGPASPPQPERVAAQPGPRIPPSGAASAFKPPEPVSARRPRAPGGSSAVRQPSRQAPPSGSDTKPVRAREPGDLL